MNLSGQTKAEVRALLRGSKPPENRAAAESAIMESLHLLCGEDCGVVMAYAAIGPEPVIDEFICALNAEGRRVCLPVVDSTSGELAAGRVRDLASLQIGRFGVREPEGGSEVVPIHEIGIVLVPGVGFDRRGYRLGRGGGFYDRFLARLGPARRVGVVFENRVVDCLPHDTWDERVGWIVTESGVVIARGD